MLWFFYLEILPFSFKDYLGRGEYKVCYSFAKTLECIKKKKSQTIEQNIYIDRHAEDEGHVDFQFSVWCPTLQHGQALWKVLKQGAPGLLACHADMSSKTCYSFWSYPGGPFCVHLPPASWEGNQGEYSARLQLPWVGGGPQDQDGTGSF